MVKLPRRTIATSLTDDELILFDVLFASGTSFRLLCREFFREQWNYPSHKLEDHELRETLKRFVDCGLLETERSDGETIFHLTAAGGQKWEAERLPAWNRYVTDSYGETRSGKPFVSITAVTSEARDDFWKIGCEVGFFCYSHGRVKTATINDDVLIGWKTFLPVHVLVAVLDDWMGMADWQAFEERRTFWRLPKENDKFWPASPSGI